MTDGFEKAEAWGKTLPELTRMAREKYLAANGRYPTTDEELAEGLRLVLGKEPI